MLLEELKRDTPEFGRGGMTGVCLAFTFSYSMYMIFCLSLVFHLKTFEGKWTELLPSFSTHTGHSKLFTLEPHYSI